MPTPFERPSTTAIRTLTAVLLTIGTLSGCHDKPSEREVNNARAFEALLTAVSLQNSKQFETGARAIEARHASGELSDANYRQIREVIDKARLKDWSGAEKRAYEFRARFGDQGTYFW